MKFSNPTQRKEHLRCPQRFYYRYQHKSVSPTEQAEHSQRGQLYGLRELAGYFVHKTLAEMTTAIAGGSRWDYDLAGRQCRNLFTATVAKSMALEPGQWANELQVAETFNGLTPLQIKDEVNFWVDSIPPMIENGFRAAHSIGIGHRNSERSVESEKRLIWPQPHPRRDVVIVMDVLMRSKYQTTVVDYKCHAIDNADVAQLRFYLEYLHRREGVCPTKLVGFAVDLRREQVVPVKYQPYKERSSSPMRSSVQIGLGSSSDKEEHPARPHPDLCMRCPYATICPSADRSAPKFMNSAVIAKHEKHEAHPHSC
jgi:CRISPR/Cas system-associated exonuclease Cas4 (RecB family)